MWSSTDWSVAIFGLLEHGEASMPAEREGPVDIRDLGLGQCQVAGAGVLLHMGHGGGLGNGEQRRPPGQEGERHLPRRGAVGAGDVGQHPPARVRGAGKSPLPNGL